LPKTVEETLRSQAPKLSTPKPLKKTRQKELTRKRKKPAPQQIGTHGAAGAQRGRRKKAMLPDHQAHNWGGGGGGSNGGRKKQLARTTTGVSSEGEVGTSSSLN